MNGGLVVLGFASNRGKTDIGSQTIANLEEGVSLLGDLIGYGESVDFACSGMAMLPNSFPQTTQEERMRRWLYGRLESDGRLDLAPCIRRSADNPINRVLYNKTQGNAIQILKLAKQNGWGQVYIVDHPFHIPRLKIALEYMTLVTRSKIDFIYIRGEIDASDNGQFVAQYLPVYWIYERLTTLYQFLWLAFHKNLIREALQ